MSWVCAQVSMIRAVSDDAALMAGPNHGSRSVRVEAGEGVEQLGAGHLEPGQQLGAGAVAEPGGDRVRGNAAARLGVGPRGQELLRARPRTGP